MYNADMEIREAIDAAIDRVETLLGRLRRY